MDTEYYNHIGVVPAIRELTEAMTPISDMAILMDKAESELREVLDDPENEMSEVYHKTKALVALRMRKNIIEMAEAGAPSAKDALLDIYNNFKNDMP